MLTAGNLFDRMVWRWNHMRYDSLHETVLRLMHGRMLHGCNSIPGPALEVTLMAAPEEVNIVLDLERKLQSLLLSS